MFKEKCCKQCCQVYGHHDKMACTNTQNITKHEVYKDTTDIKKLLFYVFFGFFWGFLFLIFNCNLKDFSKQMLNYRLGTVNEKHWGV